MLKDWFEIDGDTFDVTVTAIEESATVLYSDKSGRTITNGARMILVPLGTFYNHTITVQRHKSNLYDFDFLYTYITQPVNNGFHIKAVHNQTTIEYDGYISEVKRKLKRIDPITNKVYWDEMQISIIAMEAQVIPT